MAAVDPIGAGRQRPLSRANGGSAGMASPSHVGLHQDQDTADPGIPDSEKLTALILDQIAKGGAVSGSHHMIRVPGTER